MIVLESEHNFICDCGRTFKTGKHLTKHVATKEILAELKRIGGPKYYRVAQAWEDNPNSNGIQDFANDHDIELTVENATEIAKEGVTHIVQHYDEYEVDTYKQEPSPLLNRVEKIHQSVTNTLKTVKQGIRSLRASSQPHHRVTAR